MGSSPVAVTYILCIYQLIVFYLFIKFVYFNLIWFYDLLLQDISPISTLLCGNCPKTFKLTLYFYHSLYLKILLSQLLYSVSFIIYVNQNCVTNHISCKLYLLLMSKIYFTYLVVYLHTAHTGKYHILHLLVYLILSI